MDDLAALLGSPSANIDDSTIGYSSFGPFPPVPNASRALADALIICGTAGSGRVRSEHDWHGNYMGSRSWGSQTETVPAALLGMQQMAASAGCTPATIDELMRAARAVASTDPNPRRDWW